MEDISRFILDELLILLPCLWIIGMMLKKSNLKDWLIPWVLLAFSLLGVLGYAGLSWGNVFQAILICGMSVFGHQLYKQTTLKDAPVHCLEKARLYKL